MGWAARANPTARDAREGKIKPKPARIAPPSKHDRAWERTWQIIRAKVRHNVAVQRREAGR